MKLHKSTAHRGVVAACILVAGIAATPNAAMAQAIEEIVVTASKRGEVRIQDIPFSIQAIDGDALQEAGSLDFADYFRQIPGLSMNNQGPGDKHYIIRGIYSGGSGTVGLYFDEIIITGEGDAERGKQPDPKMFDIDRVEVLKGPQGTTFGSSSLSGTIRWIPNRPRYDAFELETGAKARTLKESDDIGWEVDGAINVPLIEDRLALRVSGLYLDRQGYIDNRFQEDANREETTAGRAMVSWRISDDVELSTLAMNQAMDVGTRSFFNETTARLPLSDTLDGQVLPEYTQASLTPGGHEEDMDLYNIKLDTVKPWGTVTATYSAYNRYTLTKRATSWASEILFGLPADENPAYLGNEKERRLSSAELRFSSSWDSPIQLLTGAFFQREDRFEVTTYQFTDPITGRNLVEAGQAARRETDRQIDELAVFGEISWNITDQLTFTGGVRWFEQEIDEQVNVITAYIYLPGTGLQEPLNFKFDDAIFKGNLSYSVSDDVMLYAQVAEGYRAGGANDQSAMAFTDVIIPAGFDSDSLINYELGTKTALLDGRLVLNGAIYWIDWTNIQLQLQAQNSQGLSFRYSGNGGSAEVMGAEIALTAYPSERLRIDASLNVMSAELTEDLPPPQTALEGDDIPYSPDTTASLSARYEHPIPNANGLSAFFSGDWSYQGETTDELRPTDSGFHELAGYSILNLRGGIQGEDWTVTLAVDNVLDEDAIIFYAPDFGTGANLGDSFFPENLVRPWPRSVSIGLRKQFY